MSNIKSIPPGYILGRMPNSGSGPPELISIAKLTQSILSTTNVAATTGQAGQQFQGASVQEPITVLSGLIASGNTLQVGNWAGTHSYNTASNSPTLDEVQGHLLASYGTTSITVSIALPSGDGISAKAGFFASGQYNSIELTSADGFVGIVQGNTIGPFLPGAVGQLWWEPYISKWILAQLYAPATDDGGGGGSGGGDGGGGQP